ncbi:38048_t:CDS:1, partial [Gigaspora margarita]
IDGHSKYLSRDEQLENSSVDEDKKVHEYAKIILLHSDLDISFEYAKSQNGFDLIESDKS